MPPSGCNAYERRRARQECTVLHNELCNDSVISKTGDSSYVHGMQDVCEQMYKESLASHSVSNHYPSMMRGSSAWTSQAGQLDFRRDCVGDDDFEYDSFDMDELNADYNITSTLCGLEEVLSRLI